MYKARNKVHHWLGLPYRRVSAVVSGVRVCVESPEHAFLASSETDFCCMASISSTQSDSQFLLESKTHSVECGVVGIVWHHELVFGSLSMVLIAGLPSAAAVVMLLNAYLHLLMQN